MTEPRWNLIRHIRAQIAAGTYDTHKRLELTAERIRECLTSGSESVTVGPAGHENPETEDDREDHGEEGPQPG